MERRGDPGGVGALALLGIARVRMEHVEIDLSFPSVLGHLRRLLSAYEGALAEVGPAVERAADELPPFELAQRVLEARREVDRHFYRIAEIDGDTRAMYAHHSVKKERIARKYLAKYGPDSRASLEDDLGALGIYFNESAITAGIRSPASSPPCTS